VPLRSVVAVALACLATVVSSRVRAQGSQPCVSNAGAHLFVAIGEHRLYLCEGASAALSFEVRLARHGAGKTKEGDGKLPVGVYSLGPPRASNRYGTFVPIGYPTEQQRRRGYTGSSVGVHGPDRRVRWLGHLVNTFDSTDGCVGVATDQEMTTIADWIRRTRASVIILAAVPTG
jgi:hypothetical protein